MFISENGLNLIKEFEGCILSAYDDYNDEIVSSWGEVRGTITIGWGITPSDGVNIYPGMTISQQEADDMFRNSMGKYCDCVNNAMNDGTISFSVNQNMFDALTSFCYNCGNGSLRSLCGGRDKDTVADKMLQYNKGNGQVLQGLVRRRQAERDLFLSDGEGGIVIQGGSCSSDPISKAREFVGDKCAELQNLLISKGYDCGGYGADGKFGQGTYDSLIQFQKDNGLQVDGLAGEQTFAKLQENNQTQPSFAPQPQGDDWVRRLQQECNNQGFSNQNVDGIAGGNTLNGCPMLREGANGEITRLLQEKLNSLGYDTNGIDGCFGGGTSNAVAQYQRNNGLGDDSIVGQATWSKLLGLS